MSDTGSVHARFFWRDDSAPVPNKPRSLGAVVFICSADGSSVLMEHRADSDTIGFIGGAVDPTETVVQAATREVFEETGLRIEDPTFVGLITDPSRIAAYPDGNVIATMTAMFIAHTIQPEGTPSAESRALVWV